MLSKIQFYYNAVQDGGITGARTVSIRETAYLPLRQVSESDIQLAARIEWGNATMEVWQDTDLKLYQRMVTPEGTAFRKPSPTLKESAVINGLLRQDNELQTALYASSVQGDGLLEDQPVEDSPLGSENILHTDREAALRELKKYLAARVVFHGEVLSEISWPQLAFYHDFGQPELELVFESLPSEFGINLNLHALDELDALIATSKENGEPVAPPDFEVAFFNRESYDNAIRLERRRIARENSDYDDSPSIN